MDSQDRDFILNRLDQIDNKFDNKLTEILVQTTKTNGRVNNLEQWRNEVHDDIEELKKKRNENHGRDVIIGVIIVTVFTIIGFYIQHLISKS